MMHVQHVQIHRSSLEATSNHIIAIIRNILECICKDSFSYVFILRCFTFEQVLPYFKVVYYT